MKWVKMLFGENFSWDVAADPSLADGSIRAPHSFTSREPNQEPLP